MGIPCWAEVFLIPCKRFHLIDHSMKRLILTAMLLIGFTVAANAQSSELTEKADQLALEMTQAVKDLMNMDIKVDEVRTFKVGVPEEIFKHVIRISHLPDDLEVVKQFRD